MNFSEQLGRVAAEYAACEGVPTEVLETVQVADLLEENEALRALLREWLHSYAGGATLSHKLDLRDRARAVLDNISAGGSA